MKKTLPKKFNAANKTTVKITAQCIMCKKKEVLTQEQIKNAQEAGSAACSCCKSPMTIIKVDCRF